MATINVGGVGSIYSLIYSIAPKANPSIVAGIEKYLPLYAEQFGLTTQKRIAAFLSQAAVETDGFNVLREYASGAEYQGRMGNNKPGDGIRYKGRGIIQVTGKENYANISKAIFGNSNTLLLHPELLEQPQYSVLSALHYWKDRNLNKPADAGNILAVSIGVNGKNKKTGLPNDWPKRQGYYNQLMTLLGLNPALVDLVKKKSNNNLVDNANDFFTTLRWFFGVEG